jgi:branched-subunit amino acid transport protein AzlD
MYNVINNIWDKTVIQLMMNCTPLHFIKLKKKKKLSKQFRKMLEPGNIDILNTCIYKTVHAHGNKTGNIDILNTYTKPSTLMAIQKWRVKLVLWTQTSTLSEMMLSCKCFPKFTNYKWVHIYTSLFCLYEDEH